MEPENSNQETSSVERTSSLHQVTPLSKYLAMALFIILPFLGGYIGYTYAPEKIIEVERYVENSETTSETGVEKRNEEKEVLKDAVLLENLSVKAVSENEYRLSWQLSPEVKRLFGSLDDAFVSFELISTDGTSKKAIGDGFKLHQSHYTFDLDYYIETFSWSADLNQPYNIYASLSYQPTYECNPLVISECMPEYAASDAVLIEQAEKYDYISDVITFSGFEYDSSLSAYEDLELGIAFEYPSSWGEITVDNERGNCGADYTDDVCNQRVLLFEDLDTGGEIFLATETLGHEENPIGRGGFWGDAAGMITTDYLRDCSLDEECNVFESGYGVVFAKYRQNIFDWNDTVEGSKAIDSRYVLYRDDSEYYGYILSPIRIKSYAPSTESKFEDTIIRTFRFIE